MTICTDDAKVDRVWKGLQKRLSAMALSVILLATDLVARGIDIEHLECVINYDIPRDVETYTHRAGRTGRMGRDGYVITFITHPEELKSLKKYASVRELVLKNSELFLNE